MRLADCLLWRVIAALAGLGVWRGAGGDVGPGPGGWRAALWCGAPRGRGRSGGGWAGVRPGGRSVPGAECRGAGAGGAGRRSGCTRRARITTGCGPGRTMWRSWMRRRCRARVWRRVWFRGPVVFVAELTTLAQPGVTALAGRTICFMNGSPAHQALEAWGGAYGHAVRAERLPGGWRDARCVRCASLRRDGWRGNGAGGNPCGIAGAECGPCVAAAGPGAGVRGVSDRGMARGRRWWGGRSAGSLQSEAAPSPWRGDLPGADFPGLRPGWQQAVVAAVGTYGAMTRRAFGPDSELGLQGGANALWPEGADPAAGPALGSAWRWRMGASGRCPRGRPSG